MSRSRHEYLPCLLTALLALCGCHASPWSADGPTSYQPPTAPAGPETPSSLAPAPPVPDIASGGATTAELQQVMAEVRRLSADDPAVSAELLAQLQASEPSLWPLVAESFRARLAYGEQLRREETLATRTVEPYPPLARDAAPTIEPVAESPAIEPHVARLPTADRNILPPSGPDMARPPIHPDPRLAAAPNHAQRSRQLSTAVPQDDTTTDWQAPLTHAIAILDNQMRQTPDEQTAAAEVKLRLLQLAAGRHDEAAVAVDSADPSLSRYWTSQIAAINTLLAADEGTPNAGRLSEARRHLRDASRNLGEAAALEVRNLAFCRAVQSYGSIERFEKYEFTPGQRVLLYAEVENFRTESTPRGYHSSLQSSYQIFDAAGGQVARHESTTTEEYCLNPRRDYFIGCDFHLPKDIHPGTYLLKLAVEDLKADKTGEASIEFTVK
ncbi:MAG: hypothetical protein JW888_00820 [Pirellulales bacterium]|nr:hypothetical protein [Pirellulales bacterium]